MDATSPATRAAFSLEQLFSRSLDAALPGLEVLGVQDPAQKLAAAEWREGLP